MKTTTNAKETEKQILTLDSASIRMLDTATFIPTHPIHGKIESLSMTFCSPMSAKAIAEERKRQVRLLKERMAKKTDTETETETKTEDLTEPELKKASEEQIASLASVLIDWGDGFILDGKRMEPTKENAIKIFSDQRFYWLFVSALAWWNKEINFFLD